MLHLARWLGKEGNLETQGPTHVQTTTADEPPFVRPDSFIPCHQLPGAHVTR